MSRTRVVCVLSGGGAKSAAHVGAMRALSELGVEVIRFVGTSMGAVIGASFAAGLDYEDMLRRITRLKRSDVARPTSSLLLGPFADSLLSDAPLRRTIARLVPVREFTDLQTPLSVTAVDMANGQLEVFGAGGRPHVPLHDALYASCALPVYYPPARIGDRDYGDGGLRSVLPLDIAYTFEADAVVAVSVGPSLSAGASRSAAPSPPLLRAHDQSVRILMAKQTEREIARWKSAAIPLILVQPIHAQRATFDVGAAIGYVEEGYRATMRAMGDRVGA